MISGCYTKTRDWPDQRAGSWSAEDRSAAILRSVRGIDRLAPFLDVGADPADEPDLRVRKRTAVATALLLIVATLVFAAAYTPYGIVSVMVIALAQIAAFAAAIVLFARTHRLGPFVGMLIAVGLTLLIVNLVPTGGLASGPSGFVWAVLAPVGAVLFLGPRAGHKKTVGCV